jgi:hypothetical protein
MVQMSKSQGETGDLSEEERLMGSLERYGDTIWGKKDKFDDGIESMSLGEALNSVRKVIVEQDTFEDAPRRVSLAPDEGDVRSGLGAETAQDSRCNVATHECIRGPFHRSLLARIQVLFVDPGE